MTKSMKNFPGVELKSFIWVFKGVIVQNVHVIEIKQIETTALEVKSFQDMERHKWEHMNERKLIYSPKTPVSNVNTVKPVLSSHSKIDKTKVLMANVSLKMDESIAAFCNTFDLH